MLAERGQGRQRKIGLLTRLDHIRNFYLLHSQSSNTLHVLIMTHDQKLPDTDPEDEARDGSGQHGTASMSMGTQCRLFGWRFGCDTRYTRCCTVRMPGES